MRGFRVLLLCFAASVTACFLDWSDAFLNSSGEAAVGDMSQDMRRLDATRRDADGGGPQKDMPKTGDSNVVDDKYIPPADKSSAECLAPKKYYLDNDKDGYGNLAVSVVACVQPAGYVLSSTDCNDDDDQAHPGQNGYFSTPTKNTTSYDYDCSGIEEKQYTHITYCAGRSQVDCTQAPPGWSASVPSCGVTASWVTCAVKMTVCEEVPTTMTQACR